ncbi:MAG: hypothetical protein P9X24_12315 [Candidatus Hatepunaea meridiana]|nr:hypothetical protein [Candidatus Hatepunaea meridiana]
MEFESLVLHQESFLVWLYQGISVETNLRRKEDWNNTLDALEPFDPSKSEDTLYILPADLDEAPLRIKYATWEKLQKEKYNHLYIQARSIKDNLIRTGTIAQRNRMFNRDLETAILSYRDEYYKQAILRFNELINRYGYFDLADVVFYRGECFFSLAMYSNAYYDYIYVYKNSNESHTRQLTLKRLIAISGEEDDDQKVLTYWSNYEDEIDENKDDEYWATTELTARYLMSMQKWEKAKELLDEISPKYENFVVSKLLVADCALALLNLSDADSLYSLISKGKTKGKGSTKKTKKEASLKLGYIDYLRGDYYEANKKLSKIEGIDEYSEKAAIISAWSLYHINDFGGVIGICNKFLKTFKESQFFYEVFCILGYCEDLLGRDEEAVKEYEEVIHAMNDQRDFQHINFEKKNVAIAIGELQRLEPDLFLEGRRELFNQYQELRSELKLLFDRLKLTEGMKSSPLIREMLDEQKQMSKIFTELEEIEKELFDVEDVRLSRKHDLMYTKMIDLASQLQSGIRYGMQQKSLIHREQEQLFKVRYSDSLKVRLDKEWQSTEESLVTVRELLASANVSGDNDLQLELSEIELGFMNVQNKLLSVSKNLGKVGPVETNSNLDHWMWFAFQRHSTAGLSFDYLYMRKDRITEIDQYIQRLNKILADRQHVEEKLAELPENIIPAGEPGSEPYYAPKVPLWISFEEREALADTMVIDEAFEDSLEQIEGVTPTSGEETEAEPEKLEEPPKDHIIEEEPVEEEESEIPEQNTESTEEGRTDDEIETDNVESVTGEDQTTEDESEVTPETPDNNQETSDDEKSIDQELNEEGVIEEGETGIPDSTEKQQQIKDDSQSVTEYPEDQQNNESVIESESEVQLPDSLNRKTVKPDEIKVDDAPNNTIEQEMENTQQDAPEEQPLPENSGTSEQGNENNSSDGQ